MKRKLLLSAAALFLFSGCGVNGTNGSGEKVGQIVRVTKQGFITDTWEAELIRGGMNNGSGSFGTTPFHFTIKSRDEVEMLKKYMENQTEVILHYEVAGIYSLSDSDSGGTFMTSVEPMVKR